MVQAAAPNRDNLPRIRNEIPGRRRNSGWRYQDIAMHHQHATPERKRVSADAFNELFVHGKSEACRSCVEVKYGCGGGRSSAHDCAALTVRAAMNVLAAAGSELACIVNGHQ